MGIRAFVLASVLLPLLQQARAGVIEGDVVDGDTGQVLAGARVKLGSRQSAPMFTITDSSGRFRFSAPDGPGYFVAAQKVGYMGPQDSPHSTHGGSAVFPGSGQPLHITLIRYAVIAGTVTDSDGLPLPFTPVRLLRKSPVEARMMQRPEQRLADGSGRLEQVAYLATDQRGAYRVARVRAGTYYVVAEPRSSYGQPVAHATYYGGAIEPGAAKPVEAVAGRTLDGTNIEVQQRRGVSVSGRFVNPPAAAGSGDVFTHISLRPLSGIGSAWFSASIRDDRFEIEDVLPGQYLLFASMQEGRGRPEARQPLAGAIQALDVGSVAISGLTLALQPPRDLPGTVRFAAGCRPGSVRLSIWASAQRTEVTAEPDGSFVFKNLVPSRYSLNASIRAGEFAALGTVRLGGREAQGEFVMQAEDSGPLQIEIACPHGSVSFDVADASGAPAADSVVVLVSIASPGYTRRLRAGGKGKGDVSVPPDIYDVFACSSNVTDPTHSPECRKAPAPVTIKDGSALHLSLTLPAAARKEGSQ